MNSAVTRSKILPAGPDAYASAVKVLRAGGLVALPTETVYGLAALAKQDAAVQRVYAAKGRPAHNPLITHILSPEQVGDFAELSPLAGELVARFWPGPLTLVLPRKRGAPVSAIATVDLPTIAIRCPRVGWTSEFAALGFEDALIMPSANRSGHVSPTTAAHVAADLADKIDLIIDAGPCDGGIESTVLQITGQSAGLLRPGSLPIEDIIPITGPLIDPDRSAAPSAPGMLKSHYAPKAQLRLNAAARRPGEAFIGFGAIGQDADINLSPSGDLFEAARHLYAALRALDTVDVIAIAPIPEHGMGAAINDRLARAAADREAG